MECKYNLETRWNINCFISLKKTETLRNQVSVFLKITFSDSACQVIFNFLIFLNLSLPVFLPLGPAVL